MKKPVFRTCTACRIKQDKREFLRIAKDKDNNIYIDKTGKLDGRGAYICYNEDCLNKLIKTKKLERGFNVKISEEIYNEIRGVIIDRAR